VGGGGGVVKLAQVSGIIAYLLTESAVGTGGVLSESLDCLLKVEAAPMPY
jgi:hypothetical protein